MPRYNQDRNILATVGFQPTVFTPVEFTPVEVDYGKLADSFEKIRQANQLAVQQRETYTRAMNEARQKLNQNEETLKRFDAKVAKELENIQTYADAMDPQGAYEAGITAVNNVLDEQYNAEVKHNAQWEARREEQRKRINNGISKATFDWWNDTHKYSDDFIYDGDKIIGEHDIDNADVPVDDINSQQLALTAFKLISPEKGTYEKTTNINDRKSDSRNKSLIQDITEVRANQYERVNISDILSNMDSIIGDNPDTWKALEQGFQVALHEIEKMKQERDKYAIGTNEYNLKQELIEQRQRYFTGENHQELTNTKEGWKIYYSRIITDNMAAHNLAYDWKNTTIKDIEDTSNRNISAQPAPLNNQTTSNTQSTTGNMTVKKEDKTSTAAKLAADAVNNTTTQFNEHKTIK